MLMFDQKDPTVASILNTNLHHKYQYNKIDSDFFDPYLFDSQFLKYAQVLDTDYENFLLLYSCQEYAEFNDDEGYVLPQEYAWTKTDKKHIFGQKVEFKFQEDLKVQYVYKDKVQILWRASKKEIDVQTIH